MTVRSENKIVPVNLPSYHLTKLNQICKRMGLTKSAVIQRLLEQHQMLHYEEKGK